MNVGLVPSDDKPLPEPMLTQVYVAYGVTTSWSSVSAINATDDHDNIGSGDGLVQSGIKPLHMCQVSSGSMSPYGIMS